MTHSLRRRLDRLAGRAAAGRLIVLDVADDRTEDRALVGETLADAGIVRDGSDLLVLVKRYATREGEPPCALLSVTPLARSARRARR
jgi:hypothetical protein